MSRRWRLRGRRVTGKSFSYVLGAGKYITFTGGIATDHLGSGTLIQRTLTVPREGGGSYSLEFTDGVLSPVTEH